MVLQTPFHAAAERAGAAFTEQAGWQVPLNYGDAGAEYAAACGGAAVIDLSPRAKVEVSGKDAAMFLHNLCSNDVKGLAPGAGCEAFFTTAKARVVAHVFLSRLPGAGTSFLLDAAAGTAGTLRKHLDHFLISEDADLADRTADFGLLRLCGPQAVECLRRAFGGAPELSPWQTVELPAGDAGACHLRRNDTLGGVGFDLFVPAAADLPAAVWDRLQQAGAVPAGLQVSQTLRVEAGFPEFGTDIDENRLVMEVGRTPQAINYAKGCFLGQEPIVMARDRGHVNRTLLGLKLAGAEPVPAGSKVYCNGDEVGEVTSSVHSPRLGGAVALAYLRRSTQQPGTEVDIDTPAGPRQGVIGKLPLVGPG